MSLLMSQNQPLLPGVSARPRTTAAGGQTGQSDFYYNGIGYNTAADANNAASKERQQAANSNNGTRINGGAGGVYNTGGNAPASYTGLMSGGFGGGSGGNGGGGGGGDVYVRDPNNPNGPLIRQSAYEASRQATQNAGSASDYLKQRVQANTDLESRRMDEIRQLETSFGGSHAPLTYEGVNGAAADAARGAAFARAKEQAGQTALASLKALQSVFEDRGQMGSSAEANTTAGVVGKAGGEVNDFTREQLMQDLGYAQHVGDTNFNAAVTQRGQDSARLQSLLGLLSSSGSAY